MSEIRSLTVMKKCFISATLLASAVLSTISDSGVRVQTENKKEKENERK